MGNRRTLVRIAHAYGNRRHRIAQAVAAGVDLIETDLRFDRGTVWVRHEHRVPGLPLLFNNRLHGIHREGPYARSFGPLFVRVDVERIRLPEVVAAVSGRSGLLLDLKAGTYTPSTAERFVDAVLGILATARFDGRLGFCGSWRLLDVVRTKRPDLTLHYSVDRNASWGAFLARAEGPSAIRAVSIQRRLLTEERAKILSDRDVDVYCWDVANAADAADAVACGAAGVIADDLGLLRDLAGTPVRTGAM